MANPDEQTVSLSEREFLYLRGLSDLKDTLRHVISGAELSGPGKYRLRLSGARAEDLRSALTDRLAKVGFDSEYAPTEEGEVLERLIDLFYRN